MREGFLVAKLRTKLKECEAAIEETTGLLERIVGDVTHRTFDPRKCYPKAAALKDWFYDQKEYDGPSKERIL
jgi:hypothetical protein